MRVPVSEVLSCWLVFRNSILAAWLAEQLTMCTHRLHNREEEEEEYAESAFQPSRAAITVDAMPTD